MTRKRIIALALTLAFALAFAAGCGNDSGGGTAGGDLPKIELTLTLHDPVTSRIGQAMQAWADEVYQKTDGGLTITLFGAGSLAPGPAALDFVMDGAADIGWLFTMFYPGQFTLAEVIALPMNGPTHPAQAAEVLWDLYEAYPEMAAEIDSKVHVLTMYGNPFNFISTVNTPVMSMADLQGMKLRSPAGNIMRVLQLWGASPEAVPAGDVYDALQKGNIAGTMWEWQGLEAFKLYEQLNYYMEGMPVYLGCFILGMNKEKWDSLPQAYKDVLNETTRRSGSVAFGQTFQDAFMASRAAILAETPNANIIAPPDAAIAEFKAIADAFTVTWVQENTTANFDAQAYLDFALASAARHAR